MYYTELLDYAGEMNRIRPLVAVMVSYQEVVSRDRILDEFFDLVSLLVNVVVLDLSSLLVVRLLALSRETAKDRTEAESSKLNKAPIDKPGLLLLVATGRL